MFKEGRRERESESEAGGNGRETEDIGARKGAQVKNSVHYKTETHL